MVIRQHSSVPWSVQWVSVGTRAIHRYNDPWSVQWSSVSSFGPSVGTIGRRSVQWPLTGTVPPGRYNDPRSVQWPSVGTMTLRRYNGPPSVPWYSVGTIQCLSVGAMSSRRARALLQHDGPQQNRPHQYNGPALLLIVKLALSRYKGSRSVVVTGHPGYIPHCETRSTQDVP